VAGSSENKANLAQLGQELGLSLAKFIFGPEGVRTCRKTQILTS
jgi:hypothetical protein